MGNVFASRSEEVSLMADAISLPPEIWREHILPHACRRATCPRVASMMRVCRDFYTWIARLVGPRHHAGNIYRDMCTMLPGSRSAIRTFFAEFTRHVPMRLMTRFLDGSVRLCVVVCGGPSANNRVPRSYAIGTCPPFPPQLTEGEPEYAVVTPEGAAKIATADGVVWASISLQLNMTSFILAAHVNPCFTFFIGDGRYNGFYWSDLRARSYRYTGWRPDLPIDWSNVPVEALIPDCILSDYLPRVGAVDDVTPKELLVALSTIKPSVYACPLREMKVSATLEAAYEAMLARL